MEKKLDLSFLDDIQLTEDKKAQLDNFFEEYNKILKEKYKKEFLKEAKKELLEYHKKNMKIIKNLKSKNKKLKDIVENKIVDIADEIANVSEKELTEAIIKDPMVETFNKITSLVKPFIEKNNTNNNIITESEINEIISNLKGERNMEKKDRLFEARKRLRGVSRIKKPIVSRRVEESYSRFDRPSSLLERRRRMNRMDKDSDRISLTKDRLLRRQKIKESIERNKRKRMMIESGDEILSAKKRLSEVSKRPLSRRGERVLNVTKRNPETIARIKRRIAESKALEERREKIKKLNVKRPKKLKKAKGILGEDVNSVPANNSSAILTEDEVRNEFLNKVLNETLKK